MLRKSYKVWKILDLGRDFYVHERIGKNDDQQYIGVVSVTTSGFVTQTNLTELIEALIGQQFFFTFETLQHHLIYVTTSF